MVATFCNPKYQRASIKSTLRRSVELSYALAYDKPMLDELRPASLSVPWPTCPPVKLLDLPSSGHCRNGAFITFGSSLGKDLNGAHLQTQRCSALCTLVPSSFRKQAATFIQQLQSDHLLHAQEKQIFHAKRYTSHLE